MGKPDALFAAWLALLDGQRNVMDAEFRDIFELICVKGKYGNLVIVVRRLNVFYFGVFRGHIEKKLLSSY